MARQPGVPSDEFCQELEARIGLRQYQSPKNVDPHTAVAMAVYYYATDNSLPESVDKAVWGFLEMIEDWMTDQLIAQAEARYER